MTYASYKIDSNGNITMMSGCTNDPDGKIARENAAKRANKSKVSAEKLLEKKAKARAEKIAREKALKEKILDNSEQTYRATGLNLQEITNAILRQMKGQESAANFFDALV